VAAVSDVFDQTHGVVRTGLIANCSRLGEMLKYYWNAFIVQAYMIVILIPHLTVSYKDRDEPISDSTFSVAALCTWLPNQWRHWGWADRPG